MNFSMNSLNFMIGSGYNGPNVFLDSDAHILIDESRRQCGSEYLNFIENGLLVRELWSPAIVAK